MATKSSSRKAHTPPTLARKLLLANIGLCDRLLENSRSVFETAKGKAFRFLDWLVEEGKDIESDVLHRLEENESFAFSEAHFVVMGRHFAAARERLTENVEHLVDDAGLTRRAITRTAKRVIHDIVGDDLTRIKGIGPKREAQLHADGIRTFEQLAFLSRNDATELEIKPSWRKQAKQLAADIAVS